MRLLKPLWLLFVFLNVSFIQTNFIYADKDIKDTIIDVLDNITCETQGVGNLLRSEFSHTCIPAPFFTFVVANIVAPVTYANTLLRLKINDDDLFPHSCDRRNRIDPKDPKISFAICSNILLTAAKGVAVAKSTVAIAKAMITGEDPWDDIAQAWSPNKKDTHEIRENKQEGDEGIIFDVGLPPVIPWKIIKENDKLCVATSTITFDWIAVGCKYIKEPYPRSIYADFMDLSDGTEDYEVTDPRGLTKCSSSSGCYKRAYDNSQTGIVITAPLIECVRQMVVRLLVDKDLCSSDDSNSVAHAMENNSSTLFRFQKNMHRAVTALLTLYVILFGCKILLTGDVPPRKEIFNFAAKVIFVTYFAVGINIQPYSDSGSKLDGMTQWAFPILLGGINQIANWILSAAPSDLCKFDPTTYKTNLSYISLWDALDCRVSHYLGLDMIKTMLVDNLSKAEALSTDTSFDAFNFPIPPYYYLLVPAVLSGNMTLVSLALMYPLLVISVAAYLINAVVVCMISIVILGTLGPIFVPMLLFEYTRSFFESWVKLLISFMLQPMIACAFMITMFSIYDTGFYGQCTYKISSLKSEGRDTKIFYINDDWKSYKSDEAAESCKNSLGFMLNNPVTALYDFNKKTIDENITNPQNLFNTLTKDYMSKFPFLDSISSSPSLFFTSPKMIFEKIKSLVLALITACFTLYLMYNFSAQLSGFAADMTEGISLSSSTIAPQSIFKAGMKALQIAGAANKAANKIIQDRKDAAAKGADNSQATDKISTGSASGSSKGDIISRDTAKIDEAQEGGNSKEALSSDRISTSKDKEQSDQDKSSGNNLNQQSNVIKTSTDNSEKQSDEKRSFIENSKDQLNKNKPSTINDRGDSAGNSNENIDFNSNAAQARQILRSQVERDNNSMLGRESNSNNEKDNNNNSPTSNSNSLNSSVKISTEPTIQRNYDEKIERDRANNLNNNEDAPRNELLRNFNKDENNQNTLSSTSTESFSDTNYSAKINQNSNSQSEQNPETTVKQNSSRDLTDTQEQGIDRMKSFIPENFRDSIDEVKKPASKKLSVTKSDLELLGQQVVDSIKGKPSKKSIIRSDINSLKPRAQESSNEFANNTKSTEIASTKVTQNESRANELSKSKGRNVNNNTGNKNDKK